MRGTGYFPNEIIEICFKTSLILKLYVNESTSGYLHIRKYRNNLYLRIVSLQFE